MSRNDARQTSIGPSRPAVPALAGMLLAVAAALPAGGALARSSDRQQPMDIEAGRQVGTLSGDSVNQLSGGVHITQGSLDITSSSATITLAGGDPSRAVFTGGPVALRQQLDDGSPMSARADSVDYNLKTEIVVFTGNVSISNPRGTLSGQRVVYNLKTGNVESGGEGGGKVKVRILPKSAQGGGA
jgi:lipopolysaccharide export system protein LptA